MNRETVTKYKNMFENLKKNLIYTGTVMNEDFHIQKDDIMDEVDLSSSELESSMRLRLRNREALFVKKIDEALARIASGTFGECEDCGDEIEGKRLEARPTATLCVNCKEEQERQEHHHIDGHRAKSVGKLISFRSA